jgi:hypothetical protein
MKAGICPALSAAWQQVQSDQVAGQGTQGQSGHEQRADVVVEVDETRSVEARPMTRPAASTDVTPTQPDRSATARIA